MHKGYGAALARMLVVKKYPNRRLYDTSDSRYITLEDLADRIRQGADVIVQDAQTGADLTQATLTQIILESRGGARLLPVPLLVRLIRMGDDALAEFFGTYISWALEFYVQAKQGARALLPFNPLATAPFAATDALARFVLGPTPWGAPVPAPPPATEAGPTPAASGSSDEGEVRSPGAAPTTPAAPPRAAEAGAVGPSEVASEMARLRAEVDELKRSLGTDVRAAQKRPRTRR